MVNASSVAAVQATEIESKKRKQTLERARANHLSRQLQMRLQYARLKVDHGWQRQSLNEVENLYFHHSHMRGPRPYPSSILSTSAHPTLLQPTPAARSHPIHSSLSFKQHLTGPSKSGSVIESTNGETDAQAGIFKAADVQLDEAIDYSSQDMQEPDLPPPNSSSRIGSVLLPPEDSLVSIDVEADLTTLEQMPSPTDDPFTPNTTLTPSITAKTKLKSGSKSKQKIRSPHSPAQGVSNLANPVNSAISHTIDNSQSNSNNNAIAYEFGKSTLTYDFFWSSHSTASTSIKSKSTTSPASKSYRNVFGVSVGAAEADTGRSGSR